MSAPDDRKRPPQGSPTDAIFPHATKRPRHSTTVFQRDKAYQCRQRPHPSPLTHDDYNVGWICALHIEMAAARAMLDNIHDEQLQNLPNDDNQYVLGDIGKHNIAIACLPMDGYGTNNAAIVANNMKRSFPCLQICLLVGIGGGIPGNIDIRLGDIVVGRQVIQYDMGKTLPGGCVKRTGIPRQPPHPIRTAISKLRAMHETETSQIPFIHSDMLQQHPGMHTNGYAYPSSSKDRLFLSTYNHDQQYSDCSWCDVSQLVDGRPTRRSTDPKVHYEAIASGNQVIKDAETRDRLGKELNVGCFEMEAAGLPDDFPCLVVRGICDYADSHKNKEWQQYAAATAAAYAKELLSVITPNATSTLENLDAERVLPSDRQKELLDSLRFDQIDARHENIRKAHTKTCEWLLGKAEYLDWLNPSKLIDHHGFLWVKGKPGAGKSTLMKFALNNAQTKMNHRIPIAFFFNARGHDLEKSTTGMYRSLLLQLLERLPELQGVFNSIGLVTWNGPRQWSVELLKDLFEQAVLGLGRSSLVCFIDALDECDEGQIRDMIRFFERMGELTTSAHIAFQVCFSSRHYPHITISKGLNLILEGQEGHDQDIASYLDSELKIGRSKLAEEIRVDLKQKASGVFMWIVLVVGILQQEYDHGSKQSLRRRLREIPADLHTLFHQILTRDDKHRDKLLVCIQWVLFAREPLKPEQLYFAVLSSVNPEDVTAWDPDEVEELDIRRSILSSSKGLAEVTKSKKSPTVQFIHESVRDFLLKEHGLGEIWSDLGADLQGQSHERLKLCCLGYINTGIANPNIDTSLPNVSFKKAADKAFPFLEYAVRNLLYHADAAEWGGVSQKSFLQTFSLVDWIKWSNLFETYAVRRHTPKASLLYILAELNLASLIGNNLSNLSCFEVEGERYGLPLLAALATDSHEAVRILLEAQAETEVQKSLVESLDGKYYQDGKKRAHLGRNFKFSRRRGLLSYLAEAGDEVLVAFVLALGTDNADINNRDKEGRTSLSHAVTMGSRGLEVVTQLLDRGAQIEAADEMGRTPLSHAITMGSRGLAVVTQLLDRGAQIDATNKNGLTPLFYAIEGGSMDMVQLLLDRGAQIEVTAGGRLTLLGYAARYHGQKADAIVQLLLDLGLKIEAADNDDRTPLSYASGSGSTANVQLLLDRGAKIEAADNSGRTPLSYASQNRSTASVQLLLDRGAKIKAADNNGRTPLSHAARCGSTATVQLLLDRGGKIEVADKSGETPLLLAARCSATGSTASMRLLLDRGAQIERVNKTGQTPLFLATRFGRCEAVRLLLDRGAQTEAADEEGRTPLSYAAEYGFEQEIKALLNHGAQIDAVDKSGQTPLSRAREPHIKKMLQQHAAKSSSTTSP